MSQRVRQLLENARRDANNSRNVQFAGGNYMNFAGGGMSPQTSVLSADGTNDWAMGTRPRSKPYILQVSNTSGSAATNVDIFGALTYLQNAPVNNTWSAGSLTTQGVVISSVTPNMTYSNILYGTTSNPFIVGQTMIQAVVNNAQVFIPYTITSYDLNGRLFSDPITPYIDPYQQQSGVSIDYTEYRMDGNTKLTFTQIAGSAVFTIYIFPQITVNPSRVLTGGAPNASYTNPGVIRNNVAVVPAGNGSGNGSVLAVRAGQ